MKKFHLQKKGIVVLVAIFIILAVGITALLYFLESKKYDKYNTYSNQLEKYGFADLYDNEKTTSSEYVTKLELVKLVIACTSGKYKLDDITTLENGADENSEWIKYANNMQIATNINLNEQSMNQVATIEEMYSVFANAKQSILKKSLDTSAIEIKIKNFDSLSGKNKAYIIDLIVNDILENSNTQININKKLRKGELNQLLVKYIQHYCTITLNNAQLVTNKEDMPSNSEDFPYIIKGVEKEVYEQPFLIDYEKRFSNPSKFYNLEKSNYKDIVEECENYYNYILNIDYNTINKEDFKSTIDKMIVFPATDSIVQEYVDYVKANKIQMTGKATAQLPVIYLDGMNLRVRMKLELNVLNTNTKYNLLYYDKTSNTNIKYNDSNITLYIDAVMGYVYGGDKVFNSENVIYSILLDNSKDKLTIE